jgi:uncharacterized repeat protein (TIGR01451 family)
MVGLSSRRRLSGLGLACQAALLVLLALPAFGQEVAGPAVGGGADSLVDELGRVPIFVELAEPAAAQVYGHLLQAAEQAGGVAARAAARPQAIAAAQAQIATNRAAQSRLEGALAQLQVQELYRLTKAANGIALWVDRERLGQLRRLPGVRTLHLIEPEVPFHSTSVPFLGTPEAWANTLGLPMPVQGEAITIGIIDTGIDYQHPNFGGSGVLADYQANDRTVISDTIGGNPIFPTAKVVGGTDFVGDAYAGGATVAVPDPDPMDCNGHGTHVAGTAAGFGVNGDGTTFTGPYGPTTPFSGLRIGPGTAPKALLYALRVFGCGGATAFTAVAIEWAIDPNDDGNFSDHLDVINMSLGSAYGGVNTTTAITSENAVLAEVIVVAAAGNSGDSYFIVGSPSTSGRSIAVANSSDSGIGAAFLTVTAPAAIAGSYPATAAAFTPTAPPVPSGQTGNIVLVDDGSTAGGGTLSDGCQTPFANAAAVAGQIALIDRGVCNFSVKAQNAQANGAIGVIIANNVLGDPIPPGLGGAAAPAVTIPTIGITRGDRDLIVAQTGVAGVLNGATAADTLSGSTSRGARRASSPIRLKPDLSAPGNLITSAQTGITCPAAANGCINPDASGFRAGAQPLTISGTSMASPHVAGLLALLRQLYPTRSIEELKAMAMNGALHDLTVGANGSGFQYGPGRIGAGRVDVPVMTTANVIAMNADEAGLVSVSFSNEVVTSKTEVKTVRLVNHGATAQTYTLELDTVIDAPGVAFSLPGGSSISVPAGGSATFDVQMSANAAQMDHAKEATVATLQAAPGAVAGLGNLARSWLTEEGGYVNLKQGADLKMRVPIFSAIRPASVMSAANQIATGGAPTGSTTIALSGTDVCTGTLGPGPTCTGTFPNDDVSLVTPFELQVVSPQDTTLPPFADLQYAGVAYNATTGQLLFGVSTFGDWSPLFDVTYNIYIDHNEDGTWDRILFNSNTGSLSALLGTAANQTDTHLNAVFNLATNGVAVGGTNFTNRVSPAVQHSVLYNNNVLFLTATPAQLGFTTGDTTFRYRIVTCPGSLPVCLARNNFKFDEAAGPFFWNYAAQGLDFGGSNLALDLNGATLPVTWNTANLTTNGSLGGLLLHHHNRQGSRAEVVVLEGAQTADLALTKAASSATPGLGTNVTFTLSLSNTGPSSATGVVVTDLLPAGLTYVSDNGGGAYSAVTGQWTVPGTLASGGSASLQIVATVNTTDEVCNQAQVSSSSPLDPVATNNWTEVCLMAPRSSDLDLAMAVSSPTVLVGGSVTYTLTLLNEGADPAYSVNVAESFPAVPALNPTSFVASQGTYDPATGVWNLASLNGPTGAPLAPNATATLALTVTAPNMAGALTNTANAASGNADPDTANNTASATTTVLSPASVTATKTVAGSFQEGGTVTYTVVLANSAAFDQQNNPGDELTDVLPAQLTLVSASASAGTAVANVGTNTVTWNGVVPAGGSVTVTIVATIDAGTALQTVSNQGAASFDGDGNGVNEATAPTDDPGVAGNADPTSFIVGSPAALSATKVADVTEAIPGSTVIYTLVVTNSSSAAQLDNAGPELADTLPTGLTLVSASATSGTVTSSGNTVEWNGSLAAGGSVTITIEAVVGSGVVGDLVNQGTVFFDGDGNGSNESSGLTDDPGLPAGDDPTVIRGLAPADIPTLDGLGLAALAALLAGLGLLLLRRRV